MEEEVVMSLVPGCVENVLDAATGTGRYAVRLAQMGKRVVGVDISEEMLARARANAERPGLAIDFRQASLAEIPLPDESVEAVICAMALAHVKDLGGVMREFIRVLRVGGVLLISDLHPDIQKRWGPDYTASIKDGRLIVDGQDIPDIRKGPQVPFPQYRTNVGEYVDAIQAAHGEVLTAIDIRGWQMGGCCRLSSSYSREKARPIRL